MPNNRPTNREIHQSGVGAFRLTTFFSILFPFLFLACQSDPLAEEVIDKEPPNSIWVSLNNETSAPVSLEFQIGLTDTLPERFIISKSKDTLIIPLAKERLMTIANKLTAKKDLIVSPGDSLFFHFNGEGIVLRSVPEKGFVDVFKSQFPSEASNERDSIYQLLVLTDSAQKMTAMNDFSRTDIYPIFFQKDFYEDNPEVLEQFSDATYAQISGLVNKLDVEGNRAGAYSLDLREELELRKLYLRMSFLAKRLEDKSHIKKLLGSQIFDEDFILSSQYGTTYLYFFITEGILQGEKKRTSNKLFIDYPKAYDLLDEHFSGALLAKAKWFCLERMVDSNESYETISAYATDYQNSFPDDSLFAEKFQENFLISLEALVRSKIGLNLLKEDGTTHMLTGLLNDLKGKVVYVDYWASWCAPCREAMPSSEALRDKLKDEAVAFVYFSTDNKQDAWKRASAADGLSDYAYNYLVLNHEGSEMKKNLGIDAIPRYLIFNKEGRLVERNAPDPMDTSLESILRKYIGQ